MTIKIIIVTVTVFDISSHAVPLVVFSSLSTFKWYIDNILVAELPYS